MSRPWSLSSDPPQLHQTEEKTPQKETTPNSFYQWILIPIHMARTITLAFINALACMLCAIANKMYSLKNFKFSPILKNSLMAILIILKYIQTTIVFLIVSLPMAIFQRFFSKTSKCEKPMGSNSFSVTIDGVNTSIINPEEIERSNITAKEKEKRGDIEIQKNHEEQIQQMRLEALIEIETKRSGSERLKYI